MAATDCPLDTAYETPECGTCVSESFTGGPPMPGAGSGSGSSGGFPGKKGPGAAGGYPGSVATAPHWLMLGWCINGVPPNGEVVQQIRGLAWSSPCLAT